MPLIHTIYMRPVQLQVALYELGAFHIVCTHLGEGGSSVLYISIAYYMHKKKGGRGGGKGGPDSM